MSVQRNDVQRHLTRVLAEEAQLLAELEIVLQNETEVLRSDDPHAIEHIGANRHRCIEALARLDAERSDACRMLSFGSGRGAVDQMLSWADPSAALRAQWSGNLELARRCKSLNDQNGAIVAAKLGRVRALLGKLRGAVPAPVYSAKGSRYGGLGRRELGNA